MAHLSGQELLDRRRCPTDWPILLTFLGFIFGMVVIVWWAWDNGDFNKLYYGTDWRGTACCTNGENCHQFWPNPIYYSALGSVCLANCPGQDADWASGDYHHDGAYNGTAQFPPSGLVCHCNPALVANLTDLKYGAAPGLDIPSWLMSNGRDISQVFSHPDSIVGQKCSAATAAGQSYATWTYSEALSQHVTARAQSCGISQLSTIKSGRLGSNSLDMEMLCRTLQLSSPFRLSLQHTQATIRRSQHWEILRSTSLHSVISSMGLQKRSTVAFLM